MQSNFIEIALRHGCYPVSLLHIFTTTFPRNIITGWLYWNHTSQWVFSCSSGCSAAYFQSTFSRNTSGWLLLNHVCRQRWNSITLEFTSDKRMVCLCNQMLWERSVRRVPISFPLPIASEAAVWRCSVENVFLETAQISQENTCARDSFLIKFRPQACNFIITESLAHVFFCEFCTVSKNTFFYRTLRNYWVAFTLQKQPPEVFYAKKCS